MTKEKIIIGQKELVSIVDLDLYDLDAKVDTGADSNALHCDHIEIHEDKVTFCLLDDIHPSYHNKQFTFPLYKIKKVKSSNGEVQLRPSIKVTIKFLNKKYTSVISLTNRADMKFPMLLGKRFLNKRFLVDVSLQYTSKQNQQEKSTC